MNFRAGHFGVAAVLAMAGAAAGQGSAWTTLGGDAQRSSLARMPPAQLAAPRWVASVDELGRPITFEGQSTVVTRGDRVFALGRSGGMSRLFAVDAVAGVVMWGTPVPAAVLESWASPSLDEGNGTVLVSSGAFVTSIDAASGAQVWQRGLERNTAGATVAVSGDLGARDRAFITDYDGFAGSGRLYCINIDQASAGNPYQPGEIVWSVLLGTTGANSPAYFNGVVYVASVADESAASPGVVRAFEATATTPPLPLWTFSNTANAGFFGGVRATHGAVYAASYAFSGGQLAANVVKLQRATGALVWASPCNRTDSIPVVLDDGDVLVSGGIRGFGSLPSIQRFDGATGALEWDSALDSWIDANQNQQMDPGEYVDVGGWTVQPASASRGPAPVLFAGVLPAGPSTAQACAGLLELDLSRTPSHPQFIRAGFLGAGSSPAPAHAALYTLGAGGLHAFGSAPCPINCDESTVPPVLTGSDFICFLGLFANANTRANCDGSTSPPVLTANDFLCFINRFAIGCS